MSAGRPALYVARAQPADVRPLAALAAACFARPWTERQLEQEIALGPPNEVLVARGRGEDPAATVALAFCASRLLLDELQVLELAVHPDLRRQGLGRLLLGLALRRGARAGGRVALLEVRAGNAPALALYGSLGFVPSGRRRGYYRDPVEDAVLLERGGLEALC